MAAMEQRSNIKFCVLLKKTPTETLRMLREAYGENAVKKTHVYKWHKRFMHGRISIQDDPREGRPAKSRSNENIAVIRDIIRKDRRQCVQVVAQQAGISVGSCHAILTEDLGMHRVCQHIVPRMLTADQAQQRQEVCGDLISSADKDPHFLKKIVTGDETWCFLYDPQHKRQSSEWKSLTSPRTKKFKVDRSKGKVMLEVFFDYRGIIHFEFIPEGRTVNKELYLEVLNRLRNALRRKRPDLWASQDWMLLHDNAPAHRSLVVQQYLAKHSIIVLPHPPYSPDLAPCDFELFPRMKDALKGRRFTSTDEVKTAATEALKRVSKNGFQETFEKLYKRWQKCIVARGEYFEGNVV